MTDGPINEGELESLFGGLQEWPLVGLAVSGGPDSLAMLYLYARWRSIQTDPPATYILTVDHQMRAASGSEADTVAAHAKSLGLAHDTLVWSGSKPTTGLLNAARDARYRLMSERLARELPSPRALLTAHTQDDQAETVLMRLGRGSGLTGLAGIKPQRLLSLEHSVTLIRPMLKVPKSRLEATLISLGISWTNDPTNADLRFERPRLRLSATARHEVGLSNAALAQTAARLSRADAALNLEARALERSAVVVDPGVSAAIDRLKFNASPDELRIRLLDRLLRLLGGVSPPPQMSEVERLNERWPHLPQVTLGGCLIVPGPATVSIFREPGRLGLPELNLAPGSAAVWDNRFQVSLGAAAPAACTIRALNAMQFRDLYASCEGLRAPSARAGVTLPSFWMNGSLLAVPGLGSLRPKLGIERHMPCMASSQTLETLGMLCQVAPLSLDEDAKR
jgi:tRNA(Ile)-lysidine synthase